MKNIFKIYFIIVLLFFISSCVDVGKSVERKQSGATGSTDSSGSNNDETLKKCSERSKTELNCSSDGKCELYQNNCVDACHTIKEPTACDAQKPRCQYYNGTCLQYFKAKEQEDAKKEAEEKAKKEAEKKAKEEANKIEILGENKYFKVSKQAGKTSYEIKEAVTKPTFIKKDGTLVESSSLETISYDDFSKLSHIALPESHPFTKQFLENPFVGKDFITSARPSMWGKLLVAQKTEKNTVVFSIDKDVSKPDKKVIDEAKLTELFDDFKKPENLLGKGGEGSVYRVKYNGEDYALKINAAEYEDLEKLQSTGAVAKVFGTFTYGNQPCMLMEVGQKTLEDMNKRGEKLSEEQLKTAITSFKNLVAVQKKLGIRNNDVKPNNFLLTKDNKLVVIDISSMRTRGYESSDTQLLARSLLENKLEMSLRGGYSDLQGVPFHDLEYINPEIISPDLLVKWNKKVCSEFLPKEDKCKDIKNFAEFFKLIPTEKLYEIALKINQKWNDVSGTVDQDKNLMAGGGKYRTGLPMPLVQELDNNVWQQYFDKKDNVISGFCRSIIANSQYTEEEEKEGLTGEKAFYKPFKDKYKKDCLEDGTETNIHLPGRKVTKYKLTKNFTSSADEEFIQFIKDAYSYHIYQQTMAKLIEDYSKYTVKYLISDIFNNELDKNDEVNKGLIELYNL